MATSIDAFITGEKAAVTDGKVKITFDTPSDFADWVTGCRDLARWQWVVP